VSGTVALALLPFVRLPSLAAIVVIGFSVVLHGAYKVALAELYGRADLSQGYPLARGMTPIVATLLGLVFLGETPAGWRIAGIVAIAAGIALLFFDRGAPRLTSGSFAAALAVGATVAAYSVLDAYGVRLNGDWLGFTAWLVACDSVAFVAYALLARKRAAASWRAAWARTLVSGVLGVVAFGVFMWALGRAQVGPVTALRETSIVFAAVIGAVLLKEPMTRARYAALAIVMAGLVAIL
jgi:drug/metabolite transporter (DMT)-like permease